MRVLIVAEKEGTAIHRLAVQKAKASPWHAFKIVCVHPKRPNHQQIQAFEEAYAWCDVVDFAYWKTAELLRSMYDIKKPSILTHFNPYDINKFSWHNYNVNVVVNQEQHRSIRVPNTVIELPIDLDFWEYDTTREKLFDVIMVSNRIEGKKGVLDVALACQKLGLKMALIGDISDPEYYEKVIATGVVSFFHKISDDDLRDLYHSSKIHVCNSVDNYESGTLPILEAMACGVPVLTRMIGHVPDIFNGRNMLVRRGEPGNVDEIVEHLKKLIEDENLRKEIVQEARHSLRYRGYELYALKYSKLYHHVLNGEKELVSVILPTTAGPEKLQKTLAHIMSQIHQAFEIIICHDGDWNTMKYCEAFVDGLKGASRHTIKFFQVATYGMDEAGLPYKTYGLARARNKAILEAEGQWLWLVDDRMLPAPDALEKFYSKRNITTWQWGIKDGKGKSFVENFSFVNRSVLIGIGGFNEQITQYGGMTQEIRKRWELGKLNLLYNPEAQATTERKSSSKFRRGADIARSKVQCYKLYG